MNYELLTMNYDIYIIFVIYSVFDTYFGLLYNYMSWYISLKCTIFNEWARLLRIDQSNEIC